MTENEFRDLLREKGYGDIRFKEYAPHANDSLHTHDVSVMLMVLSGSFTLALESESTTYGPGEICELAAGTLHTEKTGDSGARILLGCK